MSGRAGSYDSYAHEHHVAPKWARLVSRVLTPKPSDSVAVKALRFGGLVTSPVWAAVPTVWAHAHDEIMYNPFTPFVATPGYAQYKASRAVFGPKPAILPSSSKVTLPPRPFKFTNIPKVQAPQPKVVHRPRPTTSRPLASPTRAAVKSFASSSMAKTLRISEPSWKLKLNSSYRPTPALSTTMKLAPIRMGSSLPFRSFASNLGFGMASKLSLRKF